MLIIHAYFLCMVRLKQTITSFKLLGLQ